LSEVVPVERIFGELGRFQSAGATNFLLVNTSDIRPVAMTAKACMDFAWNGKDTMGSGDRYYHDWSSAEFGPKVADALTALYKEYFDAPAKVIQAVHAINDGDKVTAKVHLFKAKDAVLRIKSAETLGEYDKWNNWYSGDWLTSVDRTAELIDIAAKMQSDPRAPIPVGVMWNEREAYEHIMGYEGARTVDLTNTRSPKVDVK
jgi:hypothetical protein